jgi:hypothetical protein
MKSIKLIAIIIAITTVAYAQNEVDALRYSQNYHGGTARFVSMGGAYVALGGDPSALSYNPAGLGVYRTSEFTMTPTFYLNSASSKFMSGSTMDNNPNFNINNMAIVGSALTGNDEGWISANFGFAYNKSNNFHRNVLIQGQNNNSSITDYFAASADGYSYDQLNSFNEWLAWETYLIDPDTALSANPNVNYISSLDGRGETQTKQLDQSGSIGEYAFSMGFNYDHKVYFGGTIGIQSIRYKEGSIYLEEDKDDLISNFNSLEYTSNLSTRGTGFNFKFGLIYRPVDWMRIGGAVHTPTFISLVDEYSSSMNSSFSDTSYAAESPNGRYRYNLTTPFKAMGGIAFVIKKVAILSVDYEFVDYSSARLRDEKSDGEIYGFVEENNSINNHYTYAGNIRAGLEYRIGPFSIRGGYAMYPSPYNPSEVDNDGMLTTFSGGFGIRDKNFFFDLAYVHSMMNENYYLYSPDVYNIDPANIDYTTSKVLATIGVKF